MPHTKKNIMVYGVLGLAALVAAFTAFSSGGGSEKTAEIATPAPSRPAISVAPVEKAVLRDTVRGSGLVNAVELVLVQPQVEGLAIETVKADVGNHVQAGDVLVTLSQASLTLQRAQLQAARASAAAQLAQAKAHLIEAQAAAAEAEHQRKRATELNAKGNASQAALESATTAATAATAQVEVAIQGEAAAKAQIDLADAQIANVELQLQRTQIKAPYAGELIEKNATVGSIASAAGKPLFVLVRDGKLELNADVAEQDLPRLAAGQGVVLKAAGEQGQLTGSVRLVEPAVSQTSRLGRVHIIIDQADQIRSGTFLAAEIEVSEREVLAVPITAIGTDDQGSYVMSVDQYGTVHRNGVETGVRDGGRVEILSGLTEGGWVVVKAASFVRDGDQVNPVTPGADGSQPAPAMIEGS